MKFYKGLYDLYSFIEKYLILRKELDTLLEIYDRILKIIGIEPLTVNTEFYTTREEHIKDLIILSITLSSNYDELVSTKYIDLIHEGSDSIKGYDYIFKSLYQVLERKYRIFNDRIRENYLPMYTFANQARIHNNLLNETLSNMNILENIKRHITEFLDEKILSNLQNTHKRIPFYISHDTLIRIYESLMDSIQEDHSIENINVENLSIDLRDIINTLIKSKINEYSKINTCKEQVSSLLPPYEIGELLYTLSEIKTTTKIMYFIMNANDEKPKCSFSIDFSNCDYIVSRTLISKLISEFIRNPQSPLSILIEASRKSSNAYDILNTILYHIKFSSKKNNSVKDGIIEIIKSINYLPNNEFKNEVLYNIKEVISALGFDKKDRKRFIATNIVYSIIESISYTIDYIIKNKINQIKNSRKCLNRKIIAEKVLNDISLFLFMAYANIEGIPTIGPFNTVKAYTLKCTLTQNNNEDRNLEQLTIDSIMSFNNALFLVEETISKNYKDKITQIIKNYNKIELEKGGKAPSITIIPTIILEDNIINQIIEESDKIKEKIQELNIGKNMAIILTNRLLTKYAKIIIDFGNIRLEQDKKDKILTPLETIREIIEYNPSREYPLPYGAPPLLCSDCLLSM